MKKLLFIPFILAACVVFAQDAEVEMTKEKLTNKKGWIILPEEGDFALGLDANPFFGYIGDIFNNTTNNNLFTNLVNNSLYGKYYLSDDCAIRGRFRPTSSYTYQEYFVNDDNATSNTTVPQEVMDVRVIKSSSIEIAPGIEFRRGYNRLQGLYGGEVVFSRSVNSTEYTYGNAMTAQNPNPTNAFFGGNSRALDEYNNSSNLALRAFAGAEYFVLPKLSFGIEVGLFFNVASSKTTSRTVEVYTDEREVYTDESIFGGANTNTTSIGVDDNNGRIYILFHF